MMEIERGLGSETVWRVSGTKRASDLGVELLEGEKAGCIHS